MAIKATRDGRIKFPTSGVASPPLSGEDVGQALRGAIGQG